MGAIVMTAIIRLSLRISGMKRLRPLWKGTRMPLCPRLLDARLARFIGKDVIVARVDACLIIVNAFRVELSALICVSALGVGIMK
jgi:hypothetical protein